MSALPELLPAAVAALEAGDISPAVGVFEEAPEDTAYPRIVINSMTEAERNQLNTAMHGYENTVTFDIIDDWFTWTRCLEVLGKMNGILTRQRLTLPNGQTLGRMRVSSANPLPPEPDEVNGSLRRIVVTYRLRSRMVISPQGS